MLSYLLNVNTKPLRGIERASRELVARSVYKVLSTLQTQRGERSAHEMVLMTTRERGPTKRKF